MKIKNLGILDYFCKFSIQFPNTVFRARSLCSATFFSIEDSKFVGPNLHGVKKCLLFTWNSILLQTMWLTTLEFFPHILPIVKWKILYWKLKKKLISIYAYHTRSASFGFARTIMFVNYLLIIFHCYINVPILIYALCEDLWWSERLNSN
jgi:hypothetical protein